MARLFPKLQQIRQTSQRTPILQKVMSQQLCRRRTALYVDAKTYTQESLELTAQFLRVLEARRAVRGDQVEGFERFFVEVRGFGFDHFNGHDAEGPDVDFGAVFLLLDDFGCHPVRGADHSGALAFGFGEFGAEAEVGCGNVKRTLFRLCWFELDGDLLILTWPRPSKRTLSLLISRWMMS